MQQLCATLYVLQISEISFRNSYPMQIYTTNCRANSFFLIFMQMLNKLWFLRPTQHKNRSFRATQLIQSLSTVLEKLNITQQKKTCTNKPTDTVNITKTKGRFV